MEEQICDVQEREKNNVNECEYAKKRFFVFADVCISSFWRHSNLHMFADFVSPWCPPKSLLPLKNSTISAEYQPLIFADSNLCVGK